MLLNLKQLKVKFTNNYKNLRTLLRESLLLDVEGQHLAALAICHCNPSVRHSNQGGRGGLSMC